MSDNDNQFNDRMDDFSSIVRKKCFLFLQIIITLIYYCLFVDKTKYAYKIKFLLTETFDNIFFHYFIKISEFNKEEVENVLQQLKEFQLSSIM